MAKINKEDKKFVTTMMARIRNISVGLSATDEQEEEMRKELLKAAEEAGAKLTASGRGISTKTEFTPTLIERIKAAVPTPKQFVVAENGKFVKTRDQMYEEAFNKFKEKYADFMKDKERENVHDTKMTDAWTDLGKKYQENPHQLLGEEIRKTMSYMDNYVSPDSIDPRDILK